MNSAHWKTIRKVALDLANHRCALCAATENLEVHHNRYRGWYQERIYDLTVLCHDCHMMITPAVKQKHQEAKDRGCPVTPYRKDTTQ